MYKLFPLLLCNLLSCIIFGQSVGDFAEGQIVLQNGDSKSGWVNIHLQRNPGVTYRRSLSAANELFAIEQIKEVRIGDQTRYVSFCNEDSLGVRTCQWLTTLVEGKISLHRSGKGENYFLLEEAGMFYPIRLNNLPGIVSFLKTKCAAFKAQNKTYRYATHSLKEMVIDYCQCAYPNECDAKIYQEKAFTVYAGLQLGLSDATISIGENLFADRYFLGGGFRTKMVPTLALPLEIHLGKHWGFRTGFYWSRIVALRDSVNIRYTFDPYYSQIKFDFSFLEVPVFIQYRLKGQKIEPFVNAGVHVGISLKSKLSHKPVDNTTQYEIAPHTFTKIMPEFAGGAGANIALSPQLKLQIMALYTRYDIQFVHTIPAFTGDGGGLVRLREVQLLSGLLWKFGKQQ